MDSATYRFRAAALAGIAVITLTVVMAFFYPTHLDTMPAGYSTPILAIEMVPSLAAAQTLFAGNEALVHQVQWGHYLDMLFLLAYGALLLLSHWGFWLLQRRWLNVLGIAVILIAISADASENLNLMQLGDALLGQSAPPDFWLLRGFVCTKFLGIGISMLCLCPGLWYQGKLGKAFTLCTLLLAPVTLGAVLDIPVLVEAMGKLIALAWLLLFLWLIRARYGVAATVAAPAPTA